MRNATRDDSGKHSIVVRSLRGEYESVQETLNKYLEDVESKSGDADMVIISLVRLLYLLKRQCSKEDAKAAEVVTRIAASLNQFPWWPKKGIESDNKDIEKMCFWSENHIFMLLSSSVLVLQHVTESHKDSLQQQQQQQQQQQEQENSSSSPSTPTTSSGTIQFFSVTRPLCSATKWQEKLLRSYLQSKLSQGGVYECLSHVYLPYTLSALLNLVDFSDCEKIRSQARQLADLIVRQLLLVTTVGNGICTFSASSRSFWRTRQRPWGHNCNQLIRLCCGEGPDDYSAMQLTDFLLTTTYRPSQESLDAFHFRGFIRENQSLSVERVVTDDFAAIDDEEKAPFIWSAGLITYPTYLKDTKAYLARKKLGSSVPMIGMLNTFGVESVVSSYPHFAEGQTYCGVTLNVYKNKGVCLSSFERFNRRRAGFQQLTWMANVGGLPVWSQSGKGSESISKFGIFNTHSPCVSQRGRLLVAAYLPPKVLTRTAVVGSVFSFNVRMFWPRSLFDEEMTGVMGDATTHRLLSETQSSIRSVFGLKQKEEQDGAIAGGVWWAGRKEQNFIGIMCTKCTHTETGRQEDAELRLDRDREGTMIPRRVRREGNGHSWIVIVGTMDEFPSLPSFMEMCTKTEVREMIHDKDYRILVRGRGCPESIHEGEDDVVDINLCKE
jgi:hypothetical protein